MKEREKINYAKSELRNYMFLLNVCHGFESKIIEIQTRLEDMKSPSASTVMGTSTESKEYRRMDMLDKLQHYQKELAVTRHRTDKVDKFLDDLSHENCRIVTDVYIKGVHMEKVARLNARSKKTLERDINEIMKYFEC